MDALHKEHVFRFLIGLNDSYGNIIGQILLTKPFSSISKVCSLILQEEKRRSIGHGVNMVYPTEATAMYVNHNKGFTSNQGQNQGYHGSKGEHSKKERPVYTYCGLTGHIANKCYKLHRYPPGYKHKGNNKAMANQVSTVLPSVNFGNLDGFALANPHLTKILLFFLIMAFNLKLLLHHRLLLVLNLFPNRLLHKPFCLSVLYLKFNVSNFLIF